MKQMTSEHWHDLIQRYLDGIASIEEVKDLSKQLECCPDTRALYLQLQQIHALLLTGEFDQNPTSESEVRVVELVSSLERSQRTLHRNRIFLTVGTIVASVLVLCAAWSVWRVQPDRIVEIISINGPVQWTGDGGNVVQELKAGEVLTGGTIESRAVNSSVDLRFPDGSTLSTAGELLLTIADDGQKKLNLRSGVLSASVANQTSGKPMIITTPTGRFETMGTHLDVMVNPAKSKVSVRDGVVKATRFFDDRSVQISGGHSAIAANSGGNDFLSRPSDQSVYTWKANLETDSKPGEGLFVSAMRRLRFEIREALKRGELSRDQIPDVFGARLAAIDATAGVLTAEAKQIGRSRFGNVIYIVTLLINSDNPNPVLLDEKSVFRVQGKVAQSAEIHVGVGAFGTTQASAGRFLASCNVAGAFDVEIPIDQFKPFRSRGGESSPVGMEVINWFCLTSDANAELEISDVQLTTKNE